MTNKESLSKMTSIDVYRKMKRLFMTKTPTEIIKWLDEEKETVDDFSEFKPAISKDKQKCPICGRPWTWSRGRWVEARKQGFLYIKCKDCGTRYLAWGKDNLENTDNG